MLKSEIKPKAEYALREKRVPGTPFQRVRVIEHVRGNKWKVQWIDPNPGLVDYVESGKLVCAWREHKSVLKEEENAARLREYNERHGYDNDDSPVPNALQQVFDSVGDGVHFYRGALIGPPDAIERLGKRAGVTVESYVAYKDRGGLLHLPFDVALDIGRKFCQAEPSTVLLEIENTERKWTHKVERGEDYILELLNQYRASWAIVRQWAGHDAAVAAREREIQRLERLVWDAIYALQKAGLDREAARLRNAVEKP